MNTKSILRNITLMFTLSLGMTCIAQVELYPFQVHKEFNHSTNQNTNNVKHYSSSSYQEMNIEQLREQTIKTAENKGEMCTITLILDYDPEVFQPPYFSYIFDDAGLVDVALDNGDSTLQGKVAPGTYDIIAMFETEDCRQYYVIIEQQQVSSDLTLTINPESCSNKISVNMYDPDGELLKLGLVHIDEEGDIVVDEESDFYSVDVTNDLCRKDLGAIFRYSVTGDGIVLDEAQQANPYGFYVNDVSDRFYFKQIRFYTVDLTKSYVCYISTDNLTTCLVENEPNDYIHQIYNFKYTPLGRDQIGCGTTNIIWEIGNYPNFYSTGLSTITAKPDKIFTFDLWANVPYTNPYNPNEHILLQTFVDDEYDWDQASCQMTPTAWIFSPAMRINNGQKEFINIGHHKKTNYHNFELNDLYGKYDNGKIIPQLIPTPEVFTYNTVQAEGFINDYCPINAINVASYVDEDDGMIHLRPHTNYFVGRYGETLCCNEGITSTTKFNGTEIDLGTFVPNDKGTYEITVTNPNIEVDELPGHNTTTVFFDQNKEDMTPPSIEMLHFKNGNGEITDRFTTSADGIIEFYASDFDYHYYPDMWKGLFEVKPVEIQVEYAPYNTENWTELTVEEVPELFQEPGWGYFYRGSLAGVTDQAEKGWFDLKFRFEDVAGNWQEQVVSPAFRIDDLSITGINEITLTHPNDDNTIYSIAGQRMHGDINSLPRGIYIVGGKKVIK